MKKLLSLLVLLVITGSSVFAQSVSLSPGVAQQALPTFSRCSSSYAVSSSTAATTLINDGTGNSLNVHVCGIYVQIVSGTSPTFKLITGTKVSTDCDTGAANLTGAFAATGVFTTNIQLNGPVSKELCIVSGGTSPVLAGYVTYGYW